MAKLKGTTADDELNGSSLNDLFTATAGNDVMYGFDGIDRVIYSGSISKYSIKYLNGATYIVKPDNSVDELHDIEQVQFGSDVFQLTEDHLSDAMGDTRPNDLSFSEQKKTLFLAFNPFDRANIKLDILESDGVSKRNVSIQNPFDTIDSRLYELNSGDYLITSLGDTQISINKLSPDGSLVSYSPISTGVTEAVQQLSILSATTTDVTLAINFFDWGSYSYKTIIERFNYVESSMEVLNQTETGIGDGVYKLPDGTFAHVFIGLGPIKSDTVLGNSYYDTETWLKITDQSGNTINEHKLGGDEYISEAYRTSCITQEGKVVAGWIGLNHVEDPNGGMSTNGNQIRQEGYFFATITDPTDPSSTIKFLVNQNPEQNATYSGCCALSGGGIVFVWSSNADGSGSGVYARIFDSDGNAITDQFQVNSRTWDNQTSPLVTADSNGGFTVYWNDTYYGGAFQRFDNEGNPNLITITGTAKADVIFAEDGDQQILGGNGNDQISAGVGDDILLGGAGNDILKPGEGNDVVSGSIGVNTVDYSNITSEVTLSLDSGVVSFAAFEQSLSGIQNVIATAFNDTLIGSAEANIIRGGAGNDTIQGLGGNDVLYGDAGNDTLDGGDGADIMVGGIGNDTYVVDNVKDVVTEKPGEGIDTIQTSLSTFSLAKLSAIDNLTFTGTAAATLTGNALANTITGGSGNDKIDGFLGSDTMIGGQGNDSYIVDNIGDTVVENTDEGIDSVTSSVTYTLSDNVENLTLTGSKAIDGTGNSIDNLIIGNAKINTLIGGAGADTLDGGAGNDTLIGGDGADYFRFTTALGKTNIETITDFRHGEDKLLLDDAIFKSLKNLTLTNDNIVNGTSAAAANDFLIFNGANKGLYYDADGNGKAAMVQIATLVGVSNIEAIDFAVV